jgi:hypothetical protein
MSEYYTKNEMYGEKFYQIPKVLFTNPLYNKGLNDREKMAFGMLKDRFSLSKKNGWFDDEGRIFFIFSREALMKIFGCSEKTATNIKKNLIKVGLLEVKKRGQGWPDILYLKKPIVTDGDIYLIDKQEKEIEKETLKDEKNDAESLGALEKGKNSPSKKVKNTLLEGEKITPNDTEFSNTELNKTELKELVNKEINKNNLMNIANSFYSEMAPNRWSKKSWVTMTNKLIDELLEGEKIYIVNDPISYIEGCLKNICYKHDLKNGKIEIENSLDNLPFHYNWLEQ